MFTDFQSFVVLRVPFNVGIYLLFPDAINRNREVLTVTTY